MPEITTSSNLPRRSELVAAALLLALVTLFGFRELAENPNHLLVGAHRGGENDLTDYFLRTLDLPRQQVSQGRFPGWNPHLSFGSPTWGNPQSLLFYPPNWLCWWFGSAAASWLLVAHHWWAGLGSFVWARQLGTRRASALIAGAISVLAPYAIGHTAEGHYPQTCVMAWLPWTFWAFERFLASDGRKWLAVSVFLSLGFLAGHVQETFYLAVLLSGTVACCVLKSLFDSARPETEPASGTASEHGSIESLGLVDPQNDESQSFRRAATWCLAGVMTIGLVLMELLPTLLNSQLSVRASGLPLSIAGDGLKARHVQLLWNAHAFDANPNANPFGWEFCFHFGIAPAALALLALLFGRRRPGTWRIVWLLAITIAFAFGASSPLFRACYSWLPGFSSFRSPARVLYLSSSLVAVLASIGWESLWPRLWNEHSRRRFVIGAASFVALAIITGELGGYAQSLLATTPVTALRHNSSVSEFLKAQAGHARVLNGIGVYSDREAQQDGVQKVLGYEPFTYLRYGLFFDALTVEGSKLDPAGFQPLSFRDIRKPLADLAGVRYAILPAKQRELPGWKRLQSGSVPQEISLPDQSPRELPFTIFENETALPRAFVIGQVTRAGEAVRGQSPARQLEKIDPRATVLLPRDVWSNDVSRSPLVEATIESYSANEVRLRASSPGHGYLVLTDLFHPGWTATVDGQPTTVLPANIAFRAVPLPPGEHDVVFHFTAPGAKLGVLVSAFAWLLTLVLGAWGVSRSRTANS